MSYKLLYTNTAYKDIKKLDIVVKKRIRKKIEEYSKSLKTYPASLSDLETKKFINSIPDDPKTKKSYSYTPAPIGCNASTNNCLAYTIYAKLENNGDKDGDPTTHFFKVKLS